MLLLFWKCWPTEKDHSAFEGLKYALKHKHLQFGRDGQYTFLDWPEIMYLNRAAKLTLWVALNWRWRLWMTHNWRWKLWVGHNWRWRLWKQHSSETVTRYTKWNSRIVYNFCVKKSACTHAEVSYLFKKPTEYALSGQTNIQLQAATDSGTGSWTRPQGCSSAMQSFWAWHSFELRTKVYIRVIGHDHCSTISRGPKNPEKGTQFRAKRGPKIRNLSQRANM